MADIKDWNSLATPDPEWEEAVKKMGRTPDLGAFPDIKSLRAWLIEAKKGMTASFPPVPGVSEKDHQIPTRDGSHITARVYTPDGKTDCPLAIILHGGGWCIGGLENEELLCRNLANELGFVAVNVDYRLAPEHPFPTPVHDCYDATKWAVANASTFNADPKKGLIVGGTSAGAAMAIIAVHLYHDDGLSPPITGCHLMIPPVCDSHHLPEKYKAAQQSHEQNKDAAILSQGAMKLFSSNYCPDVDARKSLLFSPLLWPDQHKSFPRTYFQICGRDPLRDDGLIFERILREENGIDTKVDVYPGQPHGFHSLVPTLTASRKYVKDSVVGAKWLLHH